jgi:hypothetical protein
MYRGTQGASGIVRRTYDSDEEYVGGTNSEKFSIEQGIHERGGVGIHAHGRALAHDVWLAIEEDGAGSFVNIDDARPS